MALAGVYDIFNDRWCNQTVWLYSDPHFGDKELAAAYPDRPTNEEQVARINAKVGRKDTFICLGDVGPDIGWVQKIRGYKVLICGNHDVGASNYKRHVIKKIYDADEYEKEEAMSLAQAEYPEYYITMVDNTYDVSHRPFERWEITLDNKLFDEVYTGPLMIGEKIMLSHEPVAIPFALNLHGHDHANWNHKDWNHLNCCADVINYTPINLNHYLKSGVLSKVQDIHRETIDNATERALKRGKKKTI